MVDYSHSLPFLNNKNMWSTKWQPDASYLKNLGGYQFFLWDNWYPCFQSQGRSHCLPACFVACAQCSPQLHLWCNTCWPLGNQHGKLAILIQYLQTSIVGAQGQDLSCIPLPHSVTLDRRSTDWAMQARQNKVDVLVNFE